MFGDKLIQRLGSKDLSCSSVAANEVSNFSLWVIPKHLSLQSVIRHLLWFWNLVHIFDLHVFSDTSMHAEQVLLNESSSGQVIEAGNEGLVEPLARVSSLDLLEESILSSNVKRFVVSSQ